MREGVERLATGDYDKAVVVLARAVAAAPQEPLARVLLGSAYYWQGQVDQAMQEYQEALKLDPKNAQAHQLIGIAYAWKGDIDAAGKSFSTAAEIEPERPDIQMNLGSVEQAQGRLDLALDRFRKAVRVDPRYPLYRYQLGLLYVRLGRESDAQEELETALRLYPGYQDALLELGALRERESDLDGAVSRYRQAVKLKSRDAVARFRLAAALLKQKKGKEARQALSEAFNVSPSAKGGHLALSVAYGGKPAEAPVPGEGPKAPAAGTDEKDPAEQIEKNLSRVPPGVEAKVEVQVAYTPPARLEIKKPTEGRGTLGAALSQRVDPAESSQRGPMVAKREFILSADPAARKEQIQRMVKELRSAMASVPPGGQVHLGLNVQYQNPEQQEEGPSLHYEPRKVGNDLGLWVVGTGWMGLVQEVLPALEEGAGPDEPSLLAVGLGRLTVGESGPARAVFAKAVESDPRDVLARLGLAAACVAGGDEKSASEAYRAALVIEPKNAAAKDALEWLKR
jgi:tetratricopeptide (TPR) repeat protein